LEPSNFDAPDISSWQAPNGYAESHDECRLDAAFDDRGEAALKIIARPLRVFALAGAKKPTTKIIEPAPPLALPDKPSIAVLPLQNMSGDPEQEYFADGIVEDIITALSRVKWFFVIARVCQSRGNLPAHSCCRGSAI
jgi:hypothetical protein